MELLNEQQLATLQAAVDRIIPSDDEIPGGVEAGVADFVLRNLAAGGYFPERLEMYRAGLDDLDQLARRMYSAPFAEIAEGAQDAVLIRFESEEPSFFRLLVEQSQEGFYTSPAAYEMIGWKVTG